VSARRATARRALAGLALAAGLTGPAPARDLDCPALLAHIRTRTGLIEKAKLLETAAEGCPRDPAIAYEHAFALERLRSYPESLRQYRLAAELDPGNGKAHIGVGDTLMLLGDPAGAVAAYQRGLALDPGNARAARALDLARIKTRAQGGQDISSDEFVRVMTQAEVKGGPAESAEGPLLRMQIRFRTGSATLDDGAHGKLRVVGEALRNPALERARVEIAGHTDDAGDAEANLALSRRRAEAVRDHLAGKLQVPAGRLAVAFFGQGRPVVPNTTPDNRALNRRVEFRLLK
jgi:outer membrane protein OmpA-like peptidoglycan-associated protein